MDELEFAKNAIWNLYTDVAKINVLNGKCNFIKASDYLKGVTSFYDFLNTTQNLSCIFEDDIPRYQMFFSKENLSYLLSNSETVDFSYRRKTPGRISWITIEIIKPEDYSLENPFVLFCRKEANESFAVETNQVHELAFEFYKVVKFNLKSDKYTILRNKAFEIPHSEKARASLSAWIQEAFEENIVDNSDQEIITKFLNKNYLLRFFTEKRGNLRIRYRRNLNNQSRWVLMEIVPSPDFSIENQTATMFIRDINEEYTDELKYKEQIEKICYEDLLTGLQNRNSYIKKCEELNNRKTGSLGLIFADLNGLKNINDSKGHEAGDNYIKSFAHFIKKFFRSSSCYRIGGDEFIILMEDMDQFKFATRAENFKQAAGELKDTSASIGYSWTSFPTALNEVSSKAEKAMYAVKMQYHRLHPESIRILEAF